MTETVIQTENSFLTLTTFKKPRLMAQCVGEINSLLNVKPEIKIFGKVCKQRRDVGFFSDESIGYKYSGQMARSIPLTPGLIQLLLFINKKFGARFNGILINRYNDGTEYISAHGDDERNLDDIGVVAISYGASRIFRIRDKNKEIIEDIETCDNKIIHMGGDFQKEFTHEIPIQRHVDEERYSFTFRKHME